MHRLVAEAADLGRVAPDLPMDRILLQLAPSAEQQEALARLLQAQHDPDSPEYRQWLTPQEFGERFGPARQDLDAIAAWLASHGFRAIQIAPGGGVIEFSGAARQVEEAFQTEIHELALRGDRHIANTTELSIPAALRPVVGGIVSLHNFARRPLYRGGPAAGGIGRTRSPGANLTGGGHALSPYDFAAIYNVAALWNGNFDGAGQTIGIAGRTNLRLSDVAAFRSEFGLPAKAPQVIVNGPDPGIVSAAEETEADLDVEWAGAVAKGANIVLVVSASTNATDGVDLSSSYLVNNQLAAVISVSFGACEAALGTAGNAFFNGLWQQAAAQGISVFVAAGDSGSAGCDAPSSPPATQGFAVSGLASTPYNVAVGGTQFNDANTAAYWNPSDDPHVASAKGYIPELVWNESIYTTPGAAANGLWAGAGGVSAIYLSPSWQTGPGVPTADPGASAHHRYLPDVSLDAAAHDGYLIVQEGGLYLVSGTSAGAPSFAGILAIIDQYSGARNGNPNLKFYPLAGRTPPVFHDVLTGNNAVPCAGGSPNCSTAAPASNVGITRGYSAGAGYDLATGLGSVDAYELALNWGAGVAAGPVISSLSPNPMTGSAAAQTLTIAGSGFVSGTGLAVELISGSATTTYSGSRIVSVSPAQIQVAINAGTAAQNWTVEVVNPNGKVSNGAVLQVVAAVAAPTITSLSPNPMPGAAVAQALVITGTGFQAGAGWKVLLTYPGIAAALPAAQVTVVGPTQIQALVNVGTTVRTWSVTVVSPSGVASNVLSLQVTAPRPPPAIASLAPNPMTRMNATQTLTINGSGFQMGASVTLTSGSSAMMLVPSQVTVVSGSKLTVPVNLGTTARTWTVLVENPDGQFSNPATLTVH